MEIEDIKDPIFLRSLSIEELNKLADKIRHFLLEKVSKTGGHLSSNLGVIELTIALHYVFDCPFDKLIFDVGHQGYTHKILTGRASQFDTLRKTNGLSGFLKYHESPYDCWEAGHSSTSLSAAAGFIIAKKTGANIGEVVSIIGDASVQNGLAFAAINHLATFKDQNPIIILNDNNMSISQNVGGLTNVLNKIRIRKSYQVLHRLFPKFLYRLFRNVFSALRTFVYGNSFITSLGYKYFGPIDGHNIKELIRYFEYAKKTKQPILIHIHTQKGKGYSFAETDDCGAWHGVGPFNLSTGEPIKVNNGSKIAWSDGISSLLLEEARKNNKVQVISPAMIFGSGLQNFVEALPNQLHDVGISEEHAVVMAGAMAIAGLVPVVSIYSTFLQRAYDQLNHDVARSKSHVVFLIDRSGIVGPDGSTHQGTFDLALLNHLPNFEICMPKNLYEAKDLLQYAINQTSNPIAIRYPRGNIQKFDSDAYTPNKIIKGKIVEIYPKSKINVFTYGPVVLDFETKLKNKGVGLFNVRFIKPLDTELLDEFSDTSIVVYEEVITKGSLYSSIVEYVNNKELNIKVKSYSINDQFVHHGDPEEIKNELGLSVDNIVNELIK